MSDPKKRKFTHEGVKPLPEAKAIESEIIENRRHFHKHPELSFEEVETSKHIATLLRSYHHGAIAVTEGVGKTGVIGLIQGAHPGPCIGLRADMDALPVTETTGLPFESENKGVMHACGHDGHMAILLGAAKILSSPDSIKNMHGSVKLLFQPAEEGKGGARAMIKDGALENPHVDEVYGLHLWNHNEVGTAVTKVGPFMAASDLFYITVNGRGGHGAIPQGTNDSIVAAAHLVTALQTIVSRNVSPLDSAVVTIGQINGGFNYNVIPDKVVLCGTVRTFQEETQAMVERRMQEICDGLSKMFSVNAVLDYRRGYPCTVNRSQEHVDKTVKAITDILGTDGFSFCEPVMAAEDMSYFLNERPGCFFFLGSSPAKPGDECVPHHKSNFTVHEDSLVLGSSIFVQLVRNLTSSQP